MQINPAHDPTSNFLKLHLILSSHLRLGLPSCFFPTRFPTETLYNPLISPLLLHAPPISFFLIWSSEQYLASGVHHWAPRIIVRFWQFCCHRVPQIQLPIAATQSTRAQFFLDFYTAMNPKLHAGPYDHRTNPGISDCSYRMTSSDNIAEVADLAADQSSINLLDYVSLHGWARSPDHRFIQLSVCQHCTGADSTATAYSDLVSGKHGSLNFWPICTLLEINLLLSCLYLRSAWRRKPLIFF